MRGLWHATSRFFLLKIPFSDKDSGQKDEKQKKYCDIKHDYAMRSNRMYCDIFSKTYEKKTLMCSPKAVTTLAFMQRDCKGDCKETVKVTVKRL